MKSKLSRTEQQKNGELGLIIDEFGRAMWNADRAFIVDAARSSQGIHFTPNMMAVWNKYVWFCKENPVEKTEKA